MPGSRTRRTRWIVYLAYLALIAAATYALIRLVPQDVLQAVHDTYIGQGED